ncbi:MAG: hypothetical protein PF542_06610 [Nanoarchaeota archaeon]|nr:hypothetical protein [Nanoarchaeota archaeon]
MDKLFVFNGSSTLFDSDKSGLRHLSKVFGHEGFEADHIKRYDSEKNKMPWGLSEIAKSFNDVDCNKVEIESKKFVLDSLREDAKEFVSFLKNEGFYVAFVSSDLIEILDEVKEVLGLDFVSGNVLERVDGKFTGELEKKVDRYDRLDKIAEIVKENSLGIDDVFIVGSSVTAVPSKKIGKFVSFNSNNISIDVISDFVVSGGLFEIKKCLSIHIYKFENVEEIKKKIILGGVSNFHVIADFDGTLTKGFVGGEKSPSIIAELRNGDYLDEDYQKRAHALFDKYHPYEVDDSITVLEKKAKMEEWWKTHFDLLIEKGLCLEDVKKVSHSGRVKLREGIEEFLGFLRDNNIPLIIMSASGIGDVIPMYLKEKGLMSKNVHVISNFYEWDEEGLAIGVKEPVVHSGNKDETTLESLPICEDLKIRKNVLLLGNGINDLDMIKGFDYDNLLSVGFLDEKREDRLEVFKAGYNVVVTDNGSLDFVNDFLSGFENSY